jgi:hypothetical protein
MCLEVKWRKLLPLPKHFVIFKLIHLSGFCFRLFTLDNLLSVCSNYRSELEKYVEDGILTRLFVSFSRDKKQEKMPQYVQVYSMLFVFLRYLAVPDFSLKCDLFLMFYCVEAGHYNCHVFSFCNAVVLNIKLDLIWNTSHFR